MTKPRSYNNLRNYWKKKGEEFGPDPRATIRDHQFRLLQIDTIKDYLKKEDEAIDIGCGNGYSTLEYASNVKKIIGIDFTEALLKGAEELKKTHPNTEKVDFKLMNALNLEFPEDSFDVVIMERVLINLMSYEEQQKAITEAFKVLKPGGIYILAIVSQQGHDNINKLRNQFGLDNIKVHWHNLYLDEDKLIPFLEERFEILEVKRFGMYQFISKVIHPLLVSPEEPKFSAKINEVARFIGRSITNFRDASHQITFVLKKK